jgi:hypothetical protein
MASRTGGSGRYDAVQYPWLLTADPPVCRSGPALGVLRRCERLRRGDRCICRFAAADIADDLEKAGWPDLADYFATPLEPEDVEELARKLRASDQSKLADADLAESLALLLRDLSRLVEAGAGLTDRFSDELD